ncbi:stigma-specific STIG1-like protein 1 [Phoenix dactylifera]|uniref:Stigma-specific STIG1-like protein 1 n=1 Tax=Phoenix dactylifera TaxID=42345 RepID=A0A8B7BKT8_PHODC|nr:stigma-specific STIG1-like protein 1 [Phoenix dactylifera]XP_038985516.1 stigma-specific STIG1-like protein 1 [Phoenix dactylifera]
MALATSLASPIAPSEVEEHLTNEEVSPSLRGVSRLLAQSNPKASMTCDKYPRICYARGSPGRECCKKKCVNVMKDNQNCGWCGRRCGYGQTCCSGQCVNVLYDLRNCGACKNKCKQGGFCNYGMCNYA